MSKSYNIPRKFIIVLIFLLFYGNMGRACAATTDDLRDIIGERRVTDETFISDAKAVINKYEHNQSENELIALSNEQGDKEYENAFNRLTEEKDKELAELKESFSSNKPVEEIITKLSDVNSVMNELGALKKPNTYILDELDEGNQDMAYEYAKSVLSSTEDDYEIGIVGEGLRPPTRDNFHLIKAYGKYMEVLANVEYKEYDGIDLQVIAGKSSDGDKSGEVVSQFNGKVKAIKKKGNKYSVTIQHGQALLTVYSYLKDLQVKKGEKVKQYDVIGYAASDSVHFKVILNTVPINPLFIYGGAGERAYSQWMAENPGMVVEETNFTGVKKYAEEVVNTKEAAVSSTVTEGGVKSELKFEAGYVKPEVPVVNIDEYNQSGPSE